MKDLAIIPSPLVLAANQVLFPLLNTVIVVENRQVANHVVEYFRKEKIGVVQCEILSELPLPTPLPPTDNTLSPLFQGFQFLKPSYSKVFWKFTCRWWIAHDSSLALAMSYEQKTCKIVRRNVVTLNGTLYYSWGSIVQNQKRLEKKTSYLVADSFPTRAISLPKSDDSCDREKPIFELKEKIRDLSKLNEDLSQQIQDQTIELDHVDEDIQTLSDSLCAKKSSLSKIRSYLSELNQHISFTKDTLRQLELKHAARLETHGENKEAKQERLKRLNTLLQQLQEEIDPAQEDRRKFFELSNEKQMIKERLEKIQLLQELNKNSIEEKEKDISNESQKVSDSKVKLRVSKSLVRDLSSRKKSAKRASQQLLENLEEERKKVFFCQLFNDAFSNHNTIHIKIAASQVLQKRRSPNSKEGD